MTDPSAPAGPLELLKSRSYVGLLVLGALVGVVVATAAYFFLKGVAEAQEYLFTSLPDDLGFDGAPVWWPVPLLALGGSVVGLTIRPYAAPLPLAGHPLSLRGTVSSLSGPAWP